MNKHEFAGKMKELFPDGSDKAISKLITYAHELEASETYSKDDFFGESYVAYNLAAHKFGVDAAMQVLKVCEESCFNPWEIIDATRLVAEGVSPDKLMDKAVEGTLNFVPRESDEMEAGLEALKIGTLKIPKPNEKPSFGEESFMENNNTSTVINGELGIGDTVVSFNSSEYSYLAGIVRSIDKLGSPEHDTGNTNDDVHVDFTTLEYSPRRVSEIEGDFQKVYGDKRDFDELPLDDVIMSPGMLIRANNIDLTNRAEMDAILDSDEGATAFCNRVLLAHGLNLDGLNAATFSDNVQALMNEFYDEWQKEENKGKSKWDVLENYSEAHQIAVAFGNFNYQVENGGLHQWIYNGYFHDDAEKLTEYLESGVGLDERCQKILDTIYKLDQSARDTDCDRDGYYIEPDDEDSESQFIGDMIDCDGFDTWYYEHCGQDDWWKTVCGVIEEVTGHDFAHVQQVGEDECVSSPQLDATPSQAAGIEKSVEQVAPSLTPAQKSLNEPDAFDSQDVAVLRERVIERIDSNLADYFDTLRPLDGKAIVEKSSEIALMTEAHLYLSETYGFHLSDAQYLLQFKNPLEVVADAFEAEGFDNHRSNAMWKVLDRQDALQGNYELVSDN
ncbi:MAG: hypothetical protein FWC66_10085, partial [Oscillospiraceae bacterium]|nr:hypothetical protein [Oscillospiraceae bacterium]